MLIAILCYTSKSCAVNFVSTYLIVAVNIQKITPKSVDNRLTVLRKTLLSRGKPLHKDASSHPQTRAPRPGCALGGPTLSPPEPGRQHCGPPLAVPGCAAPRRPSRGHSSRGRCHAHLSSPLLRCSSAIHGWLRPHEPPTPRGRPGRARRPPATRNRLRESFI